MKRRSRFFIGLATAILTFGTLMATLGPARFNRHYGHHHRSEHCSDREARQDKPVEKPQAEQL